MFCDDKENEEDKYDDISEYIDDPEQDRDVSILKKNLEQKKIEERAKIKEKDDKKESKKSNYSFFDYEDMDEELEENNSFNLYINAKDLDLEKQIVVLDKTKSKAKKED